MATPRPKSLKGIAWLADYVAIRCVERDDITGFRVELFEDLGVRITVDMRPYHMAEMISFCELETANTNVVGVTLDHLFADLLTYRKAEEKQLKPGD